MIVQRYFASMCFHELVASENAFDDPIIYGLHVSRATVSAVKFRDH
jgi:hypothetical protein